MAYGYIYEGTGQLLLDDSGENKISVAIVLSRYDLAIIETYNFTKTFDEEELNNDGFYETIFLKDIVKAKVENIIDGTIAITTDSKTFRIAQTSGLTLVGEIEYARRALKSSPAKPSSSAYIEKYEETLKDSKAEKYYKAGLDYYSIGNYERALKNFTKAIKLFPDRVVYYGSRARCYHALCKYDNAAADYTKAIELDNTKMYYIDESGKTIELTPTKGMLYAQRGDFYKTTGQYDKACHDYALAVKNCPEMFEEKFRNTLKKLLMLRDGIN